MLLFILLLLFWIILNGHITVEILIFGVVFSFILTAVTCKAFGYTMQKDKTAIRLLPLVLKYIVILIKEIIVANWQVIKVVLRPGKFKLDCDSKIVRFKPGLTTAPGRFGLANSITLTPGTYTCGMDGDTFVVHALDSSFAGGQDDSVFTSQLKKMEEVAHAR